MKYRDGTEILLGDQVIVDETWSGIVVAIFDKDEFNPDLERRDWLSLKDGVLVEFSNGALLHSRERDDDGVGPQRLRRVDAGAASKN